MTHKKILLFIGLFIFVFACRNNQQTTEKNNDIIVTKNDSLKKTKVEVKEPSHNFGTLLSGEIVKHTFYIKNTGKNNLIIQNIETSCGCTSPKYDKKPIPPGKEGKIEIEFNSLGRIGKQYKAIYVFANIPEKVVTLNITANINK